MKNKDLGFFDDSWFIDSGRVETFNKHLKFKLDSLKSAEFEKGTFFQTIIFHLIIISILNV